jgi:hypothetical protein
LFSAMLVVPLSSSLVVFFFFRNFSL